MRGFRNEACAHVARQISWRGLLHFFKGQFLFLFHSCSLSGSPFFFHFSRLFRCDCQRLRRKTISLANLFFILFPSYAREHQILSRLSPIPLLSVQQLFFLTRSKQVILRTRGQPVRCTLCYKVHQKDLYPVDMTRLVDSNSMDMDILGGMHFCDCRSCKKYYNLGSSKKNSHRRSKSDD